VLYCTTGDQETRQFHIVRHTLQPNYIKDGNLAMCLTLTGPCIVIYTHSYNKSQQDALFLNFIVVKNSTCFGQTYCPSPGFFTANGVWYTVMLTLG